MPEKRSIVEKDEKPEHHRHAAAHVQVEDRAFQRQCQQGGLQDQAGQRLREQSRRLALLHHRQADPDHHGGWQGAQQVRKPGRQDPELAEADEGRSEGQVDRPGRAEDVQLQPEDGQQARQGRDEAGHSEAVVEGSVDRPDQGAGGQGRSSHGRRLRASSHGATSRVDRCCISYGEICPPPVASFSAS